VYCLSGRQTKATEQMGRPDPGNLKLSRVRLKSVILMMMMIIMMNYTLLYRQFARILSARHTSTVFIMCWLAEGQH